jgi:hypothetical protein
MVGRWHGVATNKGVCVVESDDSLAIAKWLADWTDVVSYGIYPALSDEEAAKAIS